MARPEALIRCREGLFANDAGVTDERVGRLSTEVVDRYPGWMERFSA